MRIAVAGMIATYPVGGVAWDYGQYAVGLERLGHEVHYVEDTGGQSYDPRVGRYGDDYAYGIDFLERSLSTLSPRLAQQWAVRDAAGTWHGPQAGRGAALVAEADLLLNVSGSALLRPEYLDCPVKVLVDTDPGWNHFVNWPRWDETPGWQGAASWREHDHFATYAERIGQPDCRLPTLGVDWHPTRPPVVLDQWGPEPPGHTWTTVLTWDNFRQPIPGDGRTYGTKEREFERIESLPGSFPGVELELAVGGSDPPVDRWSAAGWRVRSSEAVSVTPDDYRRYVQQSRGELSVAKNVYVDTRSGWFSCRSTCYLAAGRPVVVQDTGFAEVVPVGEGLLAFSTTEEAVAALRSVEDRYDHHASMARAVAEEHFDAGRVLTALLTRAC